jgi:hypothetical protein
VGYSGSIRFTSGCDLQRLGRAFFAAVHAAVEFGVQRPPALSAGHRIDFVAGGALKVFEEFVLSESSPRQQHAPERLNSQGVPIHPRQ